MMAKQNRSYWLETLNQNTTLISTVEADTWLREQQQPKEVALGRIDDQPGFFEWKYCRAYSNSMGW